MSAVGLKGAAARRAQSRLEMEAAILAEARRLVDEGGFEQLSMRAIARGLGYSPGALYEYFPDRDAVLSALYFHGAGGLGETMESALTALPPGTDAVATLASLAHAYRRFALDHAELYRLTFGAFAHPPAREHLDARLGGFGVLVGAVQRAIDDELLIPVPAAALAVTCWSTVHGFVSLELSGHLTGGDGPGVAPPSPEEGRQIREALFDSHVRTLFQGLLRDDKRALLDDGTIGGAAGVGALSD